MRVAFYTGGLRDVVPACVDLSWAELAETLTSFDEPKCDADPAAPRACRGKICPAKDGPAWSPVEIEGSRSDASVRALTCAVLDLDHVPSAVFEAALASVQGYACAIHSTHSHLANGPEDGCYRIVLPLSRPALPAEWRRARAAIVAALGIPADPATADLSRLYFLPTTRGGVTPFAKLLDGAPIDLDDALAAADALAGAAPLAAVASETSEVLDLAALRERLADARRAKARGTDREREQADLLGRVLDGEAIAAPSARDATLLRVTGLLAYWLPAGTPWEAALEVLRPSLAAMDCEPEGLDAWVEVARIKYARQSAARAEDDARRAASDAAVREIARAVAGRAAPTLDDARAAGANWESLLILTQEGGAKVCEHNARLYVACSPELAGTISWNEVAKRIDVRGGPMDGVPGEVLDVALAGWLQRQKAFGAAAGMVGRAVHQVARENPRDPIAEYLGEVAWDGVERAADFLARYFGAEGDPAYLAAVSRKWLLSLVARGLVPGCKVDTVLVLEGAQGVGKSSAFEALVGSAYFLDTTIELGEKDAMMSIGASWLVELGELASLRRAETPRVNQFITSRVDRYRPPYGRATVEAPRRCVFVGTTNEDNYLRDRTGNRRYWPVRVRKPDVDAVARDRDLLLAEAVAMFRRGDPWWLDARETAIAAVETEGRLEASAAEEAIDRWWRALAPAQRPRRLSLVDVAEQAMSIPPSKIDHRTRTDIGYAMARLGFRYVMRREEGSRVRFYEPTPELAEVPVQTSAARARGLALVASARAASNEGGPTP